MSIKNRIEQLEKQQPAPRGTWKDFITGAWKPDPQAWAAFIADLKPSEIVTAADEVIEQSAIPTPDEAARLASLRSVTHEH